MLVLPSASLHVDAIKYILQSFALTQFQINPFTYFRNHSIEIHSTIFKLINFTIDLIKNSN